MYPYNLCLPTNLVFGKGRVSELPDLVRGMGRNVLLAYGGGSIKKIGLYDRVKALLNGFNIVELSGIEPNPRLSSVAEGQRLCRENGIQANSALVQPIFTPYLTDEHIREFFDMLHAEGIINYKPEFLTACMVLCTIRAIENS